MAIGNHSKRLQDLIDQLGPYQQGQQGQLAGQGQQDPFGQYWSSAGTLDPAQILKILQGYTTGLSGEEQKELEELKLHYQNELKEAKLAIFKKLSSDFRQQIINSFLWKETVEEMNKTKLDKNPRQGELENKESLSRGYGGQTLGSYQSAFSPEFKIDLTPAMPDGITLDELKQAHTVACIEEELLDVKTET